VFKLNKQPGLNNDFEKPQKKARSLVFFRWLRRREKIILVAYVRYARAHRESNRLPFVLFLLLFLDAFLLVIPSMALTATAVTITPKRWKLFSSIFVLAVLLNNLATYSLGKLLPAKLIVSTIHYLDGLWFLNWLGIIDLWQNALQAVTKYGAFATFIGGLSSLPTQVITMIIGMAETQSKFLGLTEKHSITIALVGLVLGQGIKIFIFSAVIRFGWLKIEKKVVETISSPESAPK